MGGAVFQSRSCIASLCLPGSVPLFIGRPPLHTQREKVGSPFQAYTRVTGKGVGRRRCSHGAMRRLGSKAEFEGEESTNLHITISPSVWRAQRMNRCQLLAQSASLKRPWSIRGCTIVTDSGVSLSKELACSRAGLFTGI